MDHCQDGAWFHSQPRARSNGVAFIRSGSAGLEVGSSAGASAVLKVCCCTDGPRPRAGTFQGHLGTRGPLPCHPVRLSRFKPLNSSVPCCSRTLTDPIVRNLLGPPAPVPLQPTDRPVYAPSLGCQRPLHCVCTYVQCTYVARPPCDVHVNEGVRRVGGSPTGAPAPPDPCSTASPPHAVRALPPPPLLSFSFQKKSTHAQQQAALPTTATPPQHPTDHLQATV